MNFKSMLAAAGFLSVLAAAPAVAQAQQLAYTAEQLTLRAGPSPEYPIVLTLPAGLQVNVLGCLGDYLWCDVSAGSSRGWAYAGNLTYYHQNQHLPLNTVAGVVGIGVLGFALNDYWHDHYRDRPWYRDRSYWHRRPSPAIHHHHSRPSHAHDRHSDHRPSRQQQGAPIRRDAAPAAPAPPRALRNDPNSGWDSRNPDAPRADRP
jgi:uncharacterized protein YraI